MDSFTDQVNTPSKVILLNFSEAIYFDMYNFNIFTIEFE